MKIIESEYMPEIGASVVVLQKDGQYFEGWSYLQPEDRDVASAYAGCMFAEMKARIKILKWEHQEIKKELKILERLYKQLTQLKEFPGEKHSRVCSHIRKQIRILQTRAGEYKELYEMLEEEYPNMVEKRLATAREIPLRLKRKEILRKLTQEAEEMGLEF